MTASAQDWAERANHAAQIATSKAQTAVNAAMEAKQSVSFIEREVGQLRQEMNSGFEELSKEVRQLKSLPRSRTITHEDFQETPTGSYKITRDTFSTLLAEHELHRDGRRWRRWWRRFRGVVWASVGAAGGVGIERLVVWLFHL